MSFQTERPKSTTEMIAELKESKLERKSNRKALLESYNSKKASTERQSLLEATQAEVEEKALKNEHIESIRERRREQKAIKESALNSLALLESAKRITMNKVLFEMVYDAYWLDDDVKKASIQETYNEYRNVVKLVESVCGDSKTKDNEKTEFIKNVESVVEEACKKAVDRIVKEQKESGEPTKEFEFTSEEESDLDKKLSELGRDEIVDLVKKKVLTVVQDERKSGKEKAEMLKELDNDKDENVENEGGSENDESDDKDGDEPVEEGVMGDNIQKAFNKLKKAGNHIVYSRKSVSTKRIGEDTELEAAIRVYEKYSSTKFKRKDLKFVPVTDANPEFENICKTMTDEDPKKIFVVVGLNHQPTKEVVASFMVLNLMDDGTGDCMISFRTGTSDEDKEYLAAILLNRYHGKPKAWSGIDKFIERMKEEYPEEMGKEMKRTVTEAMSYTEEEPVEEGVREFFKTLKNNARHNKQVNDVGKHLNLFGKDCAGVFMNASKLQAKRQYDEAIKEYQHYISIIKEKQMDANKYIKEKGYDSAVSQAIKTGLTQEINLTKSYIEQCKVGKKNIGVSENYQATLESMIAQKQKRALRNSMGGTLFESLMIANSNSIRDEAIMEGADIDSGSTMNAALIESILQYTVLETLNTTKLYKFTSSDVVKLRSYNRSTLRS